MSDLLDLALDDLEDLPEYKNFPAGAYRVSLELSTKEIAGTSYINAKLTMIETLELESVDAVPPKEGDVCDILYNLSNEYGRADLKKLLKSLVDSGQQVSSIRDAVELGVLECLVVTSVRTGKKKEGQTPKEFVKIQELRVA